MYNILDVRDALSAQVQIAPVQRSPGLMRKARMEAQEEPYDPTTSILDRIKKYQETATINEGVDTRAMTEESLTPPEGEPRPTRRWDGPTGISGDVGGRSAAEEYLGRGMSDEEWEMLARTTYAEATNNPEEQAAIMSVILNRAKSEQYPDSIVDVVNQPNQFQAVTGTANNRRPSPRFQAFNDDILAIFEEKVTPRLGNYMSQNWLNFTASNPAAYGEGTNIGFMDDVSESEGSAQIGGTLFGTVR